MELDRPAVHNPTAVPFVCKGELVLRIEQSLWPRYECMIVYRCTECGRAVDAHGVLFERPVGIEDDGA